jgi:hypothetical protein
VTDITTADGNTHTYLDVSADLANDSRVAIAVQIVVLSTVMEEASSNEDDITSHKVITAVGT